MKSLISDHRRVRVVRNPLHWFKSKRLEQPWLVQCEFCTPERTDLITDLFVTTPRRTLGWAPDWHTAMAYATQHAMDHEKFRCPTCQCIPELTLPVREVTP